MKKFDYYIGIDVSKLTLDVSILCERENSTTTEHYKIENNEKSIAQFVKNKLGIYATEQMLFCFEDTGIYSMRDTNVHVPTALSAALHPRLRQTDR